jgi:hypothetical protein
VVQARKHSLIESVSNTAVGFGVGLASQIVIFPMFGIHIRVSQNMKMAFWFTLVSIARGYVLRRWFTHRTEA